MKKLIVIILTVLIALPAFSQLNYGLKVGLSTTTITMANAKSIVSGSTTYTLNTLSGAKYGILGGFFVRLNISKLYIQPELLFATRSNDYSLSKVNSLVDSITVKQNFNKIDIPVMVGVKLGAIRINAGPSACLLLNSPADLIKSASFKTVYSKMTFGYQAGVGLDLLKKLTIDLRYEGSLKKYQNQIENATHTTFNLDDRPNAFIFSIGLIF
ncbi:MAG: porin family protein [Bacteroidales bacterium]